MPPRRTANARRANNFRCSASRSRSRTTSTSRACRPGSAPTDTSGRPPRTPRWCAGCGPPARSSSARPTPASWVNGRSPADRRSATPATRGRANTPRAGRRAAARRPWPPGWSPRRSAPTARAASGSPRRGRTWSASSRSAGRISTWPLPEAFNGITVNGVLARTVTDAALVLDAASGNVDGDLHKPPPVRVSDFVGQAPGPLKIAMSTKFPIHGVPGQAAPRDPRRAGIRRRPARGARPHGDGGRPRLQRCGMSWNFLSRSTSGLLDWADRLGHDVNLDKRTMANMRMGRLLSENVLRKARAREAAAQRRIGWIFNLADVVLAPTTALPPPVVHDFDRRGGLSTDRTMIKACPVTWPWNLLGWPSINVPAGFTSDGLPIGVQLMGPANSEPLLISLAAELEAINGWATKQPEPWWNEPPIPEPAPIVLMRYQLRRLCPTRSRNVVDHDSVSDACTCAPDAGRRGRRDRGHAGRQRRQQAAQRQRRRSTCTPSSTRPAVPPTSRSTRSCGWPPQWHTNDVLNNRALDGDIGSDGSTVAGPCQCRRVQGHRRRDRRDQPRAGDQRRRDHQPVVLPARLHRDHVELRQLPDRRVVGEQPGPQRRRRGLRPAGLAGTGLFSPCPSGGWATACEGSAPTRKRSRSQAAQAVWGRAASSWRS